MDEVVMDRPDRRTLIRHPRELPVKVETLQPGASPWYGCTQNLSAEGLNLAVSRRFEPGTPVSITFEEGSGVPLTALARVMWVEPGRGGWLHGCRFARPVDAEEIRLLLQDAAPPPAAETVVDVVPEQTPPPSASESKRINLQAIRDKLRRKGS